MGEQVKDSSVILTRTAGTPVLSACRTSAVVEKATFRIMRYALSFQISCIAVVLGEKCNRSRDCAVTAGGPAVQCSHGVCKCERGYRPTPDKRGCVLQVLLGEECVSAEDCMSTSSNRSTECWQGVCSCPAGFRFTPDRKDCIKAAIGDPCQNSRECHVTPHTRICDNNICKCSRLYVPSKQNNNTCLRVANYNSFCEEDHQCLTNNTRCDVPKCACKKGYKWDASKCVNSEGKVISEFCLAAVLLTVPLKWL
ncbi:EGF-like and EMI domain-containing protein 1 isoform X1 [Cryptotermes secundus]|uniref:EGF-like and EMI domain-containing protein 1 isoform X1 n=1 Tax=Cryptotermes secundus TaxID=105785 RepID=UPI000CD7DE37|nr:EGF-like and EMI domain-containing protein 1 isoform X1 [Cryptotermes secundus]